MNWNTKKSLTVAGCLLIAFCLSSCASPAPQVKPSDTRTPRITDRPLNAYYYFMASQVMAKNGDQQGALEAMEAAIHLDPDSTYLRLEQAILLVEMKQKAEALVVLETLLSQDNTAIEAYVLKGKIHQTFDESENAASAYQEAIRRQPDREDVYLLLGSLYSEGGQPEKAKIIYQDLVSHIPESFIGFYYLARTSLTLKDYTQAEEAYRKSFAIRPDLEQIRSELVQLYIETNAENNLIALYEDIIRDNPDHIQTRLELAYHYLNRKNNTQANRLLKEIADRLNNNQPVLAHIVSMYLDKNDFDKAVVLLKGLRRYAPENDEIPYILGIAHEGRGDRNEAIGFFRQIPSGSKFYENAVIQTAFLLTEDKKTAKAVQLLRNALKNIPQSTEMMLFLGSLYEEMSDFEKAEAILSDGIELDPVNSKLHFRIGVVYDKWGRKDDSIASMRNVLSVEPDHAHAMNYIGYTYAEMGVNLDEAEALIKQALNIKPDDGYIIDSLGWVYFQKGLYEKAVHYLEKSVGFVPDDPVILEHLGDAYLKTSQREKALDVYRKSLDIKKDDKTTLEKKINDLEKILE